MENYVGKRLDGRYEIQEIVGIGGMAVVYKAYDNLENRTVAVKILKEEFTSNDEFTFFANLPGSFLAYCGKVYRKNQVNIFFLVILDKARRLRIYHVKSYLLIVDYSQSIN